MAQAVTESPVTRLAGVTDLLPRRRADADLAGMPVHADLASLLAAGVDAVYVATQTPTHASVVRQVVATGTHVVCEKPLAPTVEEAETMAAEAAASGVVLLVGHTHSYDAPVRLLRECVLTGRLGRLLALSSVCYTDWLRRPRTADDLDAGLGNGLIFRQGGHQFDIARYVCGGAATRMSGWTVSAADGALRGFAAVLDFAGGVRATTHYSGVGGFDTAHLTQGVGELGEEVPADDLTLRYFPRPSPRVGHAPGFGLTTATFDTGDAVLTSAGVLLYRGSRAHEVSGQGMLSGWAAVLEELVSAIDGTPTPHSGRWGAGTVEVCAGVYASDAARGPIDLSHQVPLPEGGTSRLSVEGEPE
jgi:phthalate 4,5-cis-dihydrodiol dehydrogenase